MCSGAGCRSAGPSSKLSTSVVSNTSWATAPSFGHRDWMLSLQTNLPLNLVDLSFFFPCLTFSYIFHLGCCFCSFFKSQLTCVYMQKLRGHLDSRMLSSITESLTSEITLCKSILTYDRWHITFIWLRAHSPCSLCYYLPRTALLQSWVDEERRSVPVGTFSSWV